MTLEDVVARIDELHRKIAQPKVLLDPEEQSREKRELSKSSFKAGRLRGEQDTLKLLVRVVTGALQMEACAIEGWREEDHTRLQQIIQWAEIGREREQTVKSTSS